MTTDAYFKIIQQNHKAYLETNIVTHLGLDQNKKNSALSRYLECISDYQEVIKGDLNEAMEDLSTKDKIKNAAAATVIGSGIAALAFTKTQSIPSADLFGAKTAIQGGFATLIGASCSALVYEAWVSSSEKPLNADYHAYVLEMKKAGFTDEKYAEIAGHLMKLFHYRECLLNGPVREEFIQRYYTNEKKLTTHNETDLNLSIETYFIEQLNTLFHDSFHSIYALHDKEIEAEKELPSFLKFFKQHFQSEDSRKRFTQNMQLQFMDGCIKFLKKEMEEPGFLGKYLYFIDTIIGLMAATLAVAYVAIHVFFISTFALVCIGVISACMTAMCTHLTILNTASLYYQRNTVNRAAIYHAVESITKEQKRLKNLTNNTVKTTSKDLDDLKKYDNKEKTGFANILQLKQEHTIALGGVRAWIREFASRFQESKFIQIDLSERLKSIISDAHDQTVSLANTLTRIVSSAHPYAADLTLLTKFIEATSQYILNPEHQAFIHTFEYVQKTKEQVLEIVSCIPERHINAPLPPALIAFYTRAINEGGLGGLISDLNQTKTLAPVVDEHTPADDAHPYHRFLKAALLIDLKLNASTNASMILHGDAHYRQILGLSTPHTQNLEEKITPANIENYLANSFNFLCSLNDYQNHCGWREPFQNHDQYILYRMLLIKQLANLADPNNVRVDKLVKSDIKRFAQEKLNCNAEVAFDDILNQALLVEKNPHSATIKDQFNKAHSVSELAFIANAIRVDIAYCSTTFCPQQLIQFEALDYFKNNNNSLLLGINTDDLLVPAYSEDFYNDMNQSITSTEDFITHIKTRPLLIQTKTIDRYYEVISSEIETIKIRINRLIELEAQQQPLNNTELTAIIAKLERFKTTHLPQTTTQLPTAAPVLSMNSSIPEQHIAADQTVDHAPAPTHVPESILNEVAEELSEMGDFFHEHIRAVFSGNLFADAKENHEEEKEDTPTHNASHDISPQQHADTKGETKDEIPAKAEEEENLTTVQKTKIAQLRAFIIHEDQKKFTLFCHHTTEEKKLAAADAIKDIKAHKDISNPVCFSNKHLKEIIGSAHA